jgi:probable HAF family extracellular repeat protein
LPVEPGPIRIGRRCEQRETDPRGETAWHPSLRRPGQGSAEFQRINNRGEVVGSYSKGQGRGQGGYVRDRRGRITSFDLPGAASTAPLDNNDRGELVGNYQVELGGALRGFLRDARGRYTTIQVPGSVATQAYAINNRGQVVGGYTGPDGVSHGYLWSRGRFSTIDGPVGTGATLTTSTTTARSSASTSTPRPRRAHSPLGRRRWAGRPEHRRP